MRGPNHSLPGYLVELDEEFATTIQALCFLTTTKYVGGPKNRCSNIVSDLALIFRIIKAFIPPHPHTHTPVNLWSAIYFFH